jgi:hypothetical protein
MAGFIGARVYRNSNQSIANITYTPVSFSTETFDTDAIWDAGSPTRLTAKTAWQPGADTIYGAGVFTGLSDATLQAFHEWAASVTFEAGDTVDESISIQSKLGS